MEVVKKIVMKKISEVKPYARNPRKNDKTVELLVEVIPKVGFNVPLVIDHDGVIVKGHARYAAAIRLGMKELPCVVTDADEDTIRLDRLTDNKISEFSEWIDEEFLHEVDMLNLDFDIDLDALGLPVSFDDADFFDCETENEDETDEDRRTRYATYLAEHAEDNVNAAAAIVTPEQLERAKATATQVAEKPAKYFKVVCENCGKIMFIKEGEAVFVPGE